MVTSATSSKHQDLPKMEWPGQRELQAALQQLVAHKDLPPASTVNSVANVALQHAKVCQKWIEPYYASHGQKIGIQNGGL